MKARLYGIPASHPSFAAELMLERKGIAYSRVDLPQWFHRGALRLLRFPGRTVPALVIDGRRIQTTKAIARWLDDVRPEPRLLPADRELRTKVEEIETWADDELQQYGRRLVYWALPRHTSAVGSYLEGSKLLLPRFMVTPLAPLIVRILARDHKATDAAVEADLAALPGILDRIDGWIADGVLGGARAQRRGPAGGHQPRAAAEHGRPQTAHRAPTGRRAEPAPGAGLSRPHAPGVP